LFESEDRDPIEVIFFRDAHEDGGFEIDERIMDSVDSAGVPIRDTGNKIKG